MFQISKWFRKKGSSAAELPKKAVGAEPDAMIIDYVASQFEQVGLLRQASEPEERAAKRLELLFCDCYLSEVLRGLSQSVEARAHNSWTSRIWCSGIDRSAGRRCSRRTDLVFVHAGDHR
jgi:hypothetical protein